MSDGKVTSVDSGAKKKAKRGGVGTKQVCGGLGESHTCIRSSNIPHTHAFGSVGISSGSIMAASEDVRRCQKMSENIQKNQKKTFCIILLPSLSPSTPPATYPSSFWTNRLILQHLFWSVTTVGRYQKPLQPTQRYLYTQILTLCPFYSMFPTFRYISLPTPHSPLCNNCTISELQYLWKCNMLV